MLYSAGCFKFPVWTFRSGRAYGFLGMLALASDFARVGTLFNFDMSVLSKKRTSLFQHFAYIVSVRLYLENALSEFWADVLYLHVV